MQVQKVFQEALVALLTGVLGVFVAFLIGLVKRAFAWINAKIQNVEDDTFRKNLAELNNLLETTVCNVVTSLQQTLGDDIKQSLKDGDGKYTREDLLALKDKAVDQIINQINDTDWEILKTMYDDLTQHVLDLIEVNVYHLKNNTVTLIEGGD